MITVNIVKLFSFFLSLLVLYLDSNINNINLFSIGTAFVQDLIGLIMYKYTNQGLEPELKVFGT